MAYILWLLAIENLSFAGPPPGRGVVSEGVLVGCLVAGQGLDSEKCPAELSTVGVAPLAPGPIQLPVSQGVLGEKQEPCKAKKIAIQTPRRAEPARAMAPLAGAESQHLQAVGAHVDRPDLGFAQAVFVDLEGDGQVEVLFVAVSSDAGPQTAGRTVVGLRRLSTDGWTTLLLHDTAKREQFEWGARIDGLTDLDGDGTYEVVVSVRGNHWATTDILRVESAEFVRMAGYSCGW